MKRLSLVLLLLLAGCGKEIARIPLHGEGQQGETTVQMKVGKKLALWTSLDVKYTGNAGLAYEVELLQDGKSIGKTQCNPLNVHERTSSVVTNLGDEHSAKYNGKLACVLDAPKDGPATVKAKVLVTQKPQVLQINDISLVIKE